MIWQDFVFLAGSLLSVAFLYPTLRNAASRVPRATSVPSMLIGGVYGLTFYTLGMRFSAVGSLAACSMWCLIATYRAPDASFPSIGGVRAAARTRWRAAVRRYRRFASHGGTPESVQNSHD